MCKKSPIIAEAVLIWLVCIIAGALVGSVTANVLPLGIAVILALVVTYGMLRIWP